MDSSFISYIDLINSGTNNEDKRSTTRSLSGPLSIAVFRPRVPLDVGSFR